MNKSLLFSQSKNALSGGIHFIASRNFSNIDFFQNTAAKDPNYDFSNLEVYINGELTNQVANSISANADDDVIIKAIDDHYPWFGIYRTRQDFFKSIEEPFPLMHQANGEPISTFNKCFNGCFSLASIPKGLFDNNPQVVDFSNCFWGCTSLTSLPEGLFDKNIQVTDFSYCFYICQSLSTIPISLFNKNIKASNFEACFGNCNNLTVIVQIGSTASSVNVYSFNLGTYDRGTVYCRAGSAAYTAFSETANISVDVLTY